ncbi:hypothetical protein NYR72_04870 [Actinobacillus equuli subsp. haemolyticus]|nr:hypothetical protein [Actinobacillus equuli]MDG4947920.1 hypothetical protein [Actinobacillus equuli subsp. haemolyticus]
MAQVAGTTSLGLLALAGVTPYQPKKDEEYMSDAQKEHFRKILRAWHVQIMEEAESHKKPNARGSCKLCRSSGPRNAGRRIQS